MNFFKKMKPKKNKLQHIKQVPNPRSIEEIKKEYNELLAKSGNAQYLVYVYSQELENLNRRLVEVNNEAGIRQKLDAQEVKKEEVKNEQA